MKMRKLLAAVSALVMALGLTTTAFAEDTPVTNGSATINITTTLNLPAIKVTIGTPGAVVINPYKMKYTLNSTDYTDSLITAPTSIKSNSTIKIKVDAKPTVIKNSSSDLKIATESTASRTDKAVFMELLMDNVDAQGDVATFDGSSGTPAKAVVKESSPETATITMPAAADETDGNAKYAAFRIKGDSSGTDWTSDDKVDLSIVFDIAPVIGAGT